MKPTSMLACSLSCALIVGTAPVRAAGRMIIPGSSIGSLHLGDRDTVLKALSSPDTSQEGDAAMGHIWTRFRSRTTGHQLMVYTVRDESGLISTIRQVVVDSPYFHTPSGVRTGDSLRRVLRSYPHAQLVSRMTDLGQRLDVYDDLDHGIAFAFRPAASRSHERCTAIVIHPRGKSVLSEYSSLYSPLTP